MSFSEPPTALKMLLCVALISCLIVCAKSNDTDTDFTYTDVQSFNLFCDSPLKASSPSIKKIVCNFRNTAARLGNASIFKETSDQQGGDLNIEINNCSKLLISSAFHTWRDVFSSLHLTIENVDDVIQEEMSSPPDVIPGETTSPFDVDHSSLPLSDFISFSLRNSKMNKIFPPLISDTKSLLIDIQECKIDTISEGTFRNVYKMWQFRIFKSNISRIAKRAMPDAVPIAPPPAGIHVEWAPFILNETHIGVLESEAIQLRITEKDEYFNIVHSTFLTIRKGGLRITGAGHVLVADSVFQQIQNDSIIIRLQGIDSDSSRKLMDYSTLTFMGLEIHTVDVANFLLNLQITNGKLYLMRMNFRFPEALSSIASLNNETVTIWDHNQTTFVERWIVICNCYELQNILQAPTNMDDRKKHNEFNSAIFPTVANNLNSETYDYEENKPTETSPKPFSSPNWHILNELRCYQNGSNSIDLAEFDTSYCPDTTISEIENRKENYTTLEESEKSSNMYEEPLVWYLGTTGICIFVVISVGGFVCIFKHQRKTLKIDKRKPKAYRPNNVKQVGVISEDPICGCEEGEEESQL